MIEVVEMRLIRVPHRRPVDERRVTDGVAWVRELLGTLNFATTP